MTGSTIYILLGMRFIVRESFFWTNTIWYVLLGGLTALELMVIFAKNKKRKFILAYYLTFTGITLFFETLLFIVFRAYYYYPMIIQSSSFDDALAGNLFSQFSLGATALLVAVFNLENCWILMFAGIYGIIEKLFLALGIYKHYWYQTWMTLFAMTIFFWWAKKYYQKTLKGIKPFWHYFNIFFALFALDVVTLLWGFILSGYQNYSTQFIPDPTGSPYVLAVLYYILLASTLMLIYFYKLSWLWKTIIILALYGVDYLAYCTGIIYIKEGWFLIFSTATIFGMYYSIILLDRLYKK